jgi:outer membrane protein assembly factor BamB
MLRKAFLSALLIVLIVVGGLPLIESLQGKEWNAYAVSSGDDWPMFLHDPAHTGSSKGPGPTKPVVLWNYTESRSTCVVANGVVYAGGFSNGFRSANIIAFDAYTGAKIWNYSTSSLQTSPAVYGDTLVIGINRSVIAFDALTGTKIWNYTTAARVAGDPTIINGTVYVGSGNTYQYLGHDQYIRVD